MFKFLSSEDLRNALQIKKSHFQEGIPWFGKIQNLVTVEAGWFLMILQKFKSYQVIATNSVQDSWKYHHLKILAIQMNFWLILLDGTTKKQTIILSQLNFLTGLNQLLHSLPKPEEVNNICYLTCSSHVFTNPLWILNCLLLLLFFLEIISVFG